MPISINTGKEILDNQLEQIFQSYRLNPQSSIYLTKKEDELHIFLENEEQNSTKLNLPARAANIIVSVQRLARERSIEKYETSRFLFDVAEMFFLNKTNKKQSNLTEKECDLLRALIEGESEPVKREDLLEKIWSYGANIETHTLETHIYRLRQKIEDDPANPEILVTKDDGYFIMK